VNYQISPQCRHCQIKLAKNELKAIEKQIDEFYYSTDYLNSVGIWHGLCQPCKIQGVDPFVVS
jgi:hypothetical protein